MLYITIIDKYFSSHNSSNEKKDIVVVSKNDRERTNYNQIQTRYRHEYIKRKVQQDTSVRDWKIVAVVVVSLSIILYAIANGLSS